MEGEKELSDKRAVWDRIKYNIRIYAITFSKKKAKEKQQPLNYDLATQMFEKDQSETNRRHCEEKKEALELFYEEEVKGMILRARARWHEHGEKSTKYFLNLEKKL